MVFHAKDNIIGVFLRSKISSFSFLKISCKFRKYYGKIIFLTTSWIEKYLPLLIEIHNINFSFIRKFISSSFLLNMNFHFAQSSCLYNNFFLSLKLVSFSHFKRPKTISITRKNVEMNKETFFSLIFQ